MTTTSRPGSTRAIPTSSRCRPIKAPSSPSTAARRGAAGTTRRPPRCITSRPTTRSPIASAAGSRKADRRASGAAGPRSDHLAGLDAGRGRRIRLRRPRSTRSRHRLWRQGQSLGPPNRAASGRRPEVWTRRELSRAPHGAGAVLTGESAQALLLVQCRLADGHRRPVVGSNQPRPHATHLGDSEERWRLRYSFAEAQPTRRGVVYTTAPSYIDENTIWAGTDDGLMHVTRDGGKSWTDVTPPALVPWSKVSLMDASPFRREHSLCRDQHLPARRSSSAHLPHAGRRQDVDPHHQRASCRQHRQRGSRGSEAPRAALRRPRAGRLCVVRRW